MLPAKPLPRSCPSCAGRLSQRGDRHGRYSSCLRCGFVHEWAKWPAIDLPGDDMPRSR